MPYTVKVKVDGIGELEVTGDAMDRVSDLINKATRKFFSNTPITETDM